jgi:hypothetical protein
MSQGKKTTGQKNTTENEIASIIFEWIHFSADVIFVGQSACEKVCYRSTQVSLWGAAWLIQLMEEVA